MKKYYTYAYLREDGTPYYIGKGKLEKRNKYHRCYYGKHHVPIPLQEKILILKENLTEEEAFKHEIYMIAVFGRKDLGTGILRNFSNGGEGHSGRIKSIEEKEKHRKNKLGCKWWNNGIFNKMSKECPGVEWNLGRINTPKFHSKLKWWNNGNQNILSEKCPGKEWVKGRIMDNQIGLKYWNDGKINKKSEECPGEGWVKGSLSKTSSGMRWWNNGTISKTSKECPGTGWVLGMLGNRGTKYWNNGIIDKRDKECPGKGWIKGRIHGCGKSKNEL